MSGMDICKIRDILSTNHESDKQQLKVIFSNKERIMVEAPAGYGKTTTVISRLAFLLATGKIPSPKKILGLTFSVNAALKVKQDVASKLPALLGMENNPNYLSGKLTITNYHGFCKSILRKYGYKLDSLFRSFNELVAISDEDIFKILETKGILTNEERDIVESFSKSIKDCRHLNDEKMKQYNTIILNRLLPQGYVTHNAILTFAIELLTINSEVNKFYSEYFRLIVIDEFQDTNILAWKLVHLLIIDKTQLLFVGDSLQRIYGFIGAYPNIMNKTQIIYDMEMIPLKNNYRFRYNEEMLKLDNNLRENARDFNNPKITDIAILPSYRASTQLEEADWIAKHIEYLLNEGESKIAILVKGRGKNTEIIEKSLNDHSISYFYALYTEDDPEYISFHRKCLELFIEKYGLKDTVSNKQLIRFAKLIDDTFKESDSLINKSLVKLLYALVEKINTDYMVLLPEERRILFIDILENKQLKQAMEYIPDRVVFGTVHSAKGLEWDYVILADNEKYILPFFSTCKHCQSKKFGVTNGESCRLCKDIDDKMSKMLLEELCIFYVAVTRARKQIFITSSKERYNGAGKCFNNSVLSCLALLPGIELKILDNY